MLNRRMLPAFCALAVVAAGAVATRAQGSLTTQDYIDIQQLYARYNLAIDSGDAAGYADTFVADGVFNTFKGREALMGFASGYAAKGQTRNRHWNNNLVITPTAEGASGTTYLLLVDISQKPPAIVTAVRYQDTLVKSPQGWRFKSRATKGDTAPPAAPATKP